MQLPPAFVEKIYIFLHFRYTVGAGNPHPAYRHLELCGAALKHYYLNPIEKNWKFFPKGKERGLLMPTRTKSRFSQYRNLLALLLTLLAFLLCAMPALAAEETQEQKVVRVGYVNVPTYEEGTEGEYKRGSGYEYLQRISYITGWKYEYVYANFSDCLRMLQNGEIDLFGNVSYTEERAKTIDFSSYPQGRDTYLLYTTLEHTDLINGDIQKLNGCRIGVTQNSLQETLLKEWLPQNEIQAEILYYNGYDTLMSAMDSGELDAIATPDLATSYEYVPIINLGFSEYYFGVAKNRPDLLSELNEALYQIQSTEVDYNNNLAARYQSQMLNVLLLNENEQAWLDAHNGVIRLGYLKTALPYSGQKDGEFTGIMKTVADALEEKLGVKVQETPFDTFEAMQKALDLGEIDIGGPAYSDFYLAEQNNLVPTSTIFASTPIIVYKSDDITESMQSIAVPNTSFINADVLKILFPQAQAYPCNDLEQALKAVAQGKAGCMVTTSSSLNILNGYREIEKLHSAEIAQTADICLLATMKNRMASSIFNKGIQLSSNVLNGSVLMQNSYTDRPITLLDFVEGHSWQIFFLVAGVILVLGGMVYSLAVNKKKLQAALAEAQSASVAKTTFLNHMSHDIRTPMNAIIGFTDIAMRRDPPENVRSCLQKIEDSSEHLLTLLNDVLDISRIESGKVAFQPVAQDITKITNVVLEIANGFLVNREIRFTVKRSEPPTPYVMADAVRIREVLVNILSNAFKFTPDGGSIVFEEAYELGIDPQHFAACYCVTDTGVGMSEEFQKHIFDEFSQESDNARTRYQGSGLGMAITKRYVELMGGSVHVKSQKGKGTTFVVKLPLEVAAKSEEKQADGKVTRKDLYGVKVLLAEDNDLNAEIAMTQLNEAGIMVTRVADGKQALETFAQSAPGSYDAILMDIMMPIMNGYEATKEIRHLPGRPDGEKIPIIALTANAFAEDVQHSLREGMNAHISKPIDMKELFKTLADLLS